MLQRLILEKQYSSVAKQPLEYQVRDITSHVDEFPYTKFYRGNMTPEPVVFNRRAGWSPQIVLVPYPKSVEPYPQHCFEASCDTVYTKTENSKPSKKCYNDACIDMYR
jgi:hypothetical protein